MVRPVTEEWKLVSLRPKWLQSGISIFRCKDFSKSPRLPCIVIQPTNYMNQNLVPSLLWIKSAPISKVRLSIWTVFCFCIHRYQNTWFTLNQTHACFRTCSVQKAASFVIWRYLWPKVSFIYFRTCRCIYHVSAFAMFLKSSACLFCHLVCMHGSRVSTA